MKYLALVVLLLFCFNAKGQGILGTWESYDDKTKEKTALIEIYEAKGSYLARILKAYNAEDDAKCEKCEVEKKDQAIVGLTIIESLKKEGEEYSGGTILDPESGDTYNCFLQLVTKDKLKVRGYIGLSIFGRTQYWLRQK